MDHLYGPVGWEFSFLWFDVKKEFSFISKLALIPLLTVAKLLSWCVCVILYLHTISRCFHWMNARYTHIMYLFPPVMCVWAYLSFIYDRSPKTICNPDVTLLGSFDSRRWIGDKPKGGSTFYVSSLMRGALICPLVWKRGGGGQDICFWINVFLLICKVIK